MRLVVCALLVGCAAPKPKVATPMAPLRDEWTSRAWEDKYDLMTGIVLPEMSRLFQRFDGAPEPTFTCKGCHGARGEALAYKMPNDLPPLDPAHLPDRRERVARFMYDEVTPKMQQLLGMSAYDPRTGRGFGCFSCHPKRARR